ncbi:MAG: response regulator [bacterium]|nr:response regulator [bacterium]
MVGNQKRGSGVGKTVLIVDDDPAIRLVLTKSLLTLGYTVVGAAETGEEAIRLALQARPQAILMDARIPAPDGLEASRAINEHHPTPIVLMTAYSDAETIEQAKEAGIMAFLRKPFDIEELEPTIEIAIKRFEDLQMLRGAVRELEGKLEHRKVIERAKGILMEQRKITEQEAFNRIRRLSMSSRRPIHEVAEAVILGIQCLQGEIQ